VSGERAFLHPTAVIDDGAEIDDGARIWHFSHVMPGARIGAGTSLGQNAFVGRGVHVGARVKVQNNVSIYEGVVIEDDAFIGPSAVFTNVVTPRAFIERKNEIAPTRVGKGASIGANAVIVCGHDVGAYAFVAAGAVVTKDVPPHALVAGNPARRMGWVSRAGRRLGDGPIETCPETGERYAIDDESCRLVSRDEPTEGPIPFVDLARLHAPLERELTAAFRRVLRSGKLILGEEVEQFERAAARTLGAKHAIGVSSGTDALLVALMALGVGPGDEVITTPFSFIATVEAIVRVGAKPVFVDIEEASFHLDPKLLESAITPRTRVILAVHLFGKACSPEILRIARARGVPLIEDAAQAFGVRTPNGFAGTLGDIGCLSFFPTKTLGALGDGGLVVTSSDEIARDARAIRSHGASAKYHHARIGGNFRLDSLQAAWLTVKLPHEEAWRERRRAIARRYQDTFAGIAELGCPRLDEGDSGAQYVVRTTKRDELRSHLTSQGIATEIYYPEPLHLQPCVPGATEAEGRCPRAERACREVLALPSHATLSDEQVERVARTVARFFGA